MHHCLRIHALGLCSTLAVDQSMEVVHLLLSEQNLFSQLLVIFNLTVDINATLQLIWFIQPPRGGPLSQHFLFIIDVDSGEELGSLDFFGGNLLLHVLQLPDHLLPLISLTLFLLSLCFSHFLVLFLHSGIDYLLVRDGNVACAFFEVEGTDITKRRVQDFLLIF